MAIFCKIILRFNFEYRVAKGLSNFLKILKGLNVNRPECNSGKMIQTCDNPTRVEYQYFRL